MERGDRRRLRAALADAAPWLADVEVGPTTVDAGTCDRCGLRPRVVATCGPVPFRTLCVDCVLAVGDEGWCDGHGDVAGAARAWARAAPPWWADAVVLWWISTGEVRPGAATTVDPDRLPAAVVAQLPAPGVGDERGE